MQRSDTSQGPADDHGDEEHSHSEGEEHSHTEGEVKVHTHSDGQIHTYTEVRVKPVSQCNVATHKQLYQRGPRVWVPAVGQQGQAVNKEKALQSAKAAVETVDEGTSRKKESHS